MSLVLPDLEAALQASTPERRARSLKLLAELFGDVASRLKPEQIGLFDALMCPLAAGAEEAARADLAERLADAVIAPRGLLRALAFDEIAVARPVLQRSPLLTDEDLAAVATEKTVQHRLAICGRAVLAAPVAETLIAAGELEVMQAVAGHPGARLSEASLAALIERSRTVPQLQGILGRRRDLPSAVARQLVDFAKEAARRRLAEAPRRVSPPTPRPDLPQADPITATTTPSGCDYTAALAAVRAAIKGRRITEADVAGFAERGEREATVCALALACGLDLARAERLFNASDTDLLLVAGKAQEWGWATVRSLISLRDGPNATAPRLRRAAETFHQMSAATARRVMQILASREPPEAEPMLRPKVLAGGR